ncbi:hypothetical protein Pcinc_039184 [Petrolisthes cinctipes]|nr:hypothetical protein Pcinc_039184 [Petrolisthes cinctipes]
MGFLLGLSVLRGRKKMVETYGALRNKLIASDGNTIDCMFIDRRTSNHPLGKKLAICCEGNVSFYELGMFSVPMKAGYSVLGWNHPGFACSTGLPFPNQEENAVDVVVLFAIHGLGFKEEDIIIYGWSIGGYTSTWAAMNYPKIAGLILDASFDDILPLAKQTMPDSLSPSVTLAIRRYLNLRPGAHLVKYPGPVTIIRRTKDDKVTTDKLNLACNRGNNLLIMLLQSRYPNLFTTNSTRVLLHMLA